MTVRAPQQSISITCPKRDAGALLYLVVERLCELSKDWSRRANTERKQLERLRGTLEEALVTSLIQAAKPRKAGT